MAETAPSPLKQSDFAVLDKVEGIVKISHDRRLYLPRDVQLQPGDKVALISVDGMWLLRKISKS